RRCIAPMPPLASPRTRSLCSYWILLAVYIGHGCAVHVRGRRRRSMRRRRRAIFLCRHAAVGCVGRAFGVYSSSLEIALLESVLLVGRRDTLLWGTDISSFCLHATLQTRLYWV